MSNTIEFCVFLQFFFSRWLKEHFFSWTYQLGIGHQSILVGIHNEIHQQGQYKFHHVHKDHPNIRQYLCSHMKNSGANNKIYIWKKVY